MFQLRRRVRQLRRRHSGAALMMTLAFFLRGDRPGMAHVLSLVFWFAPPGVGFDLTQLCSTASHVAGAVAVVACLRARGAVPRAVLRGRGFRHVSQPPRRARSLGHRTGIPPCVCVLTCRASHSSCCSRSPRRLRAMPVEHADAPQEVERAVDAHQGRSESRHRDDGTSARVGLAATTRRSQHARARTPKWLAGSSTCSAGSPQTSQMLFWLLIAVRGCTDRAARAAVRDARAEARAAPLPRADTCAGSRHPARKPARRHRRRGTRVVGSRRTPRRTRTAVSRIAVAAGSCATKFRSAIRAPRATA